MTPWFRWVLSHRRAVLVVVGLISVVAALSASRAVVATSVGELFLAGSPEYDVYLDRISEFSNDDILIVGFDAPDLLQPEWRARMEGVSEELRGLPDVRRATTLLDSVQLRREGRELRINTASQLLDSGEVDPETMLLRLRDDPLTAGLLVSETGPRAAVLVELTADPERAIETIPPIVDDIIARIADAGLGPGPVHAAGHAAVMSEILDQSYLNIRRIFPLTCLLLLVTVWLMFHRLWPALLSLGVAGLGVLWTFGLAVHLNPRIDVMMTAMPAVVLIVGFSDVVHLCSAYLIELGAGRTKEEAILESARDVGSACIWTSATTLVGFLSLTMIPTPIFQRMGPVLGFGVATALLLAMTLCPVLFSYLPEPKPLREGATSVVQGGIDRLLDGMRTFAVERAPVVLGGFGLLLAAVLWGSFQISIETDMVQRLADDNPAAVAAAWFDEHFASTQTLEIFVDTPSPGDALEPDVLAAVAELQRRTAALPGVEAAYSLVDVLEEVRETMTGETGLPTTRAEVAQYLLLLEIGGADDLGQIVDFDRQTLRIAMRADTDGFRGVADIGLAAEAMAPEIVGELATVDATGLAFLIGDWLDEIFAGQRRGLALSAVLIGVMMMIALRSAPAGLASMLPNVLPLLCLGGWVGTMWDQVDSDTFIIAIVAIGIGVDDTIHFLVRFRVESLRNEDRDEAIRRTFDFAGRAIVMTTVILVVGFLPFALSDYLTTRMMGTLLPLCLVVALLADLLLVPAMARVGLFRFRD